MDIMATDSEKELVWTAPEYEYRPKGPSWYWLTIIATILIAAFALWRRNFLFIFFVIIAEMVLIYWARRQPREIKFKLTEKGLFIDDKFYAFETFSAFAVYDKEIILRRKARLGMDLKILAADDILDRAKDFLTNYLPTFEYEESLIDHIAKIIRF